MAPSSLGFQEAAGLAARIGERMWSLLGNANLQIIMRLQDGNQTRTYVEKTAGEAHVTQSTSYNSVSDLSDAHVASPHAEVRQVSRVNWLDVRALRPEQAIVLFQNSRVYARVFYAPVKLAGVIRRNKPAMLDRPIADDLRRQFARTVGVRRAVVEGKATAAPEADGSPVLDGVLAELRQALAREAEPGERVSPVEAALAAVLSCPGERVPALPADGLADADEGDGSDAAVAVSGTAEAGGATGTEPGSWSGVAPAPEDHAFFDLLRQAARERDVLLATFTDPGMVAPADGDLAQALVLVSVPAARPSARPSSPSGSCWPNGTGYCASRSPRGCHPSRRRSSPKRSGRWLQHWSKVRLPQLKAPFRRGIRHLGRPPEL